LDIVGLTSRIREEGLIQPVVLRLTADGQYRIIAGHMRVEACKRLGWRSLPAIIRKEE
jgi:ParB family chromosome partitioning protein